MPEPPTYSVKSREGPNALAAGAGWGYLDFFLSSVSISLGDSPIKTEIMSERAVKPKPKTTIQRHVGVHDICLCMHTLRTWECSESKDMYMYYL